MTFRPTQFRPTSGRVIAIVVSAGCLVTLVALFWQSDIEVALRSAGSVAFLAALAIAVFWLPKIEVGEDDIEFRNVFMTSRVPWTAIRSIDTRWSLVLVTDHGKTAAWATPPLKKPFNTTEVFLRGFGTALPGTRSPTRPTAEVAPTNVTEVIREHWAEMMDRNQLDPPGTGVGPRRSPNILIIVIVAVLLVAAVLGAVL